MKVIDDLAQAALQQETILTIGSFDGVHRGHQALIRQVVERARATRRLAALVTFYPHPIAVLFPERAPLYLTTPGEKLALFESLDVDLVAVLPFTLEVAAISAHDYMVALCRHLRIAELWVGPDFTIGHNREGNVPRLRELGQELGYEVHVVPTVVDPARPDAVISSSRIRAFLREGRVEEAAQMLGRYPSVAGEVVVGAHRGHQLGFPTANLQVRPEQALPADGIYAVLARLGASRYPGVANVGVRPTFDNGERTVEVFIFDWKEDLYGCDLVVEFVARLREERKYERVADLVAQMEQDAAEARQILAYAPPSPANVGAGHVSPRMPSAARLPPLQPQLSGSPCPYRFEEVEHTADRALRVWGETLPDLFVGSAKGMVSLMADTYDLIPVHWSDVHLEALDRETLLVDWLNELLYLMERDELLFVEFQVQSLADTALVARAGGARAPRSGRSAQARQLYKAEIKAATFHNLELVQESGGWSTIITFDV